MNNAIEDVIAERRRQIEVEGWTPEHDDQHYRGQMAGAAVCYIVHGMSSVAKHSVHKSYWGWDEEWFKPTSHRRDLVKAASLIIAEIERIDRVKQDFSPTEIAWDSFIRGLADIKQDERERGDNARGTE